MNGKLKFLNKTTIRFILIIVVTIGFIVFIRSNLQHIKETLKIRPTFLIIIILLYIINRMLAGFKIKTIVGTFNVRLSFIEWFGTGVINNFYNYIAPKSGTILAGVYLKNNHKLDYSKYISLIITTSMITTLMSGIIGLSASLYAYKSGILDNLIFFVIFMSMILASSILLFIPTVHPFQGEKLQKLNKFLEGWNLLRKDMARMVIISCIDIAIILVLAMRYFIIFRMFSLNISISNCIIISPFNVMMHFITAVPGAYGIKEAAVGFISRLTEIGFTSGVLATFSDRIIVMVVSFILGPIFSFILLKRVFVLKREV